MRIAIKRGDALILPVVIRAHGQRLSIEDVETAEFCLGDVRKLYPGEVTYEESEGCFRLPLTQEDTLSLPEGGCAVLDVRVKFSGGAVAGAQGMAAVPVENALSGEVL